MAYVARRTDFHGKAVTYQPTVATATQPRRGLLRWIFDALWQANQRQAQRDLDHYVAWRGVSFTDSLERDIASHVFGGGWNTRR